MTTAIFTKTITPAYETIGKRTRLTGFIGTLSDESGVVLHSMEYSTNSQAEHALDDIAYELLIDYAERGLVDALPEPAQLVNWNSAPAQPITIGARVEMLAYGKGTVSRITDDEHLNVQVKFDSPSRLGSKFWFDTNELHPIADPPGENPLGDTEGDPTPPPETTPRCTACHTAIDVPSALHARTCIHCANALHFGFANRFAAAAHLQTLLDRQRRRVCIFCEGTHHTQQCPKIRARLFAPEPWKDIALGRELCRMRWKSYNAFVVLITEIAARGHLASYAASYQAYVASFRPDTDLTVEQVLATWERMRTSEPTPRLQAA